jgi:hypothetical protein
MLVMLAGCDRCSGCASISGSRGATAPLTTSAAALAGTDCSGGLLRCVDGRVEASQTAHLPHPCAGPPESKACVCPWEPVGTCGACAVDGLEVIGAATDAAIAQLCRPSEIVARPIANGDLAEADICLTDGVSCVTGVIRTCETGRPARPLAVCRLGCQTEVGVPTSSWGGEDRVDGLTDGESKDLDGVVAILCKRDHAERR